MSSRELKKLIDAEEFGKARASILVQLDKDRLRPKMVVSKLVESFCDCRLFVEDDREFTFLPQVGWTRPYWTRMCVELSDNFSETKLKHIIEVMEFLRDKGDPKFVPKDRKLSAPIGSAKRLLKRSSGPRRESRVVSREPGHLDCFLDKNNKS